MNCCPTSTDRPLPRARRGASPAPLHRHQRAQRRGQPRDGAGARASGCGIPTATASSTAWRGSGASISAMGGRRSPRRSRRQMEELAYYNTFFKTTHPPAVALAEKLARLAPAHFNRVFFTGSGSEANDTVSAWCATTGRLHGKPREAGHHRRGNAYHGSTVAGASLGGMKPMHGQGGLPIPGIHHIGQPYWFDEGGDTDPGGIRPRGGARARGARSTNSARTTSPPSSPSRSRAPAASSSRPRPTGPRSRASARSTTSCSSPTR